MIFSVLGSQEQTSKLLQQTPLGVFQPSAQLVCHFRILITRPAQVSHGHLMVSLPHEDFDIQGSAIDILWFMHTFGVGSFHLSRDQSTRVLGPRVHVLAPVSFSLGKLPLGVFLWFSESPTFGGSSGGTLGFENHSDSVFYFLQQSSFSCRVLLEICSLLA